MDVVQSGSITRRGLLKIATTVSALALVANIGLANGAAAEPNPVQRENAREGATDWQLTRVRVDRSDGCRSTAIEGYCSQQSVAAGQKLQIMVSTQPAVGTALRARASKRFSWDDAVCRILAVYDAVRAPRPELRAAALTQLLEGDHVHEPR